MIKDRGAKSAPSYKVTIGSEVFTPRNCRNITEVSVDDADDRATMGRIVIVDPRREFLDKSIIMEDTPVKIEMGFTPVKAPPIMKLMMSGKISVVEVDFSDDNIPHMTISVIDGTGKMDRLKKERTWSGKTRSDIASQIIKENGFKARVTASKEVMESVVQNYETDMQLIYKLAQEEEFICYLETDTNTIVWGERNLKQKPKLTLGYCRGGYEIISFRPQYVEKQTQKNVLQNNKTATPTDNKTGDGNVSNNVTVHPLKPVIVTSNTFKVQDIKPNLINTNKIEESLKPTLVKPVGLIVPKSRTVR